MSASSNCWNAVSENTGPTEPAKAYRLKPKSETKRILILHWLRDGCQMHETLYACRKHHQAIQRMLHLKWVWWYGDDVLLTDNSSDLQKICIDETQIIYYAMTCRWHKKRCWRVDLILYIEIRRHPMPTILSWLTLLFYVHLQIYIQGDYN